MTGSELLQEIASIWQIDRADTHWRQSGFDWSPGSHLVRVRAVPSDDPESRDRWRLSVETELLSWSSADDAAIMNRLATMAPLMTSAYSLVYRNHDRHPVLNSFSSVYVDPEMVPSVSRLFAGLALLQPIEAEQHSEQWAKDLGGEPAFVRSRRASTCDEILDFAREIYVPEGAKPSRWSNVGEFAQFERQFARCDACFGFGNESGLSIETPFGSDSALIRLRSEQPHPVLGNGLFVTVQLPIVCSLQEAAAEAAVLNLLELKFWTDFPQLGCWHAGTRGRSTGLMHSCFVPNALYAEGLASNLAFWSVGRAQWVRKTRWPELQDKTMNEIIQERMSNGLYH